MENINQLYDALLKKKLGSLEEEVEKQKSYFAVKMRDINATASTGFITGYLEIEIKNMRTFIDYAISEFKRLANLPAVDKEEIEKTYQRYIDTFFDGSLYRMRKIMESPMLPKFGLEGTVMTKLQEEKSQAMEDLSIAKAEMIFGLSKVTSPQMTIEDNTIGMTTEWDVFICHASEDKKTVVEPLANELVKRGLKVWYDRYVLRIGDSLLQKIDEGLSKSKYGIVILSPHFFQKEWTKKELDGLIQKEIGGKKVILPVWHNVKRNDIMKYSPTLAGRLAGTTQQGIDSLADELILAMSDGIPEGNPPTVLPANIDVLVNYGRVLISESLHRYSLMFALRLNYPPAKEGFKLKLLWPEVVRISNLSGITLHKGKSVNKDHIAYLEYWYKYDVKLYPGALLSQR